MLASCIFLDKTVHSCGCGKWVIAVGFCAKALKTFHIFTIKSFAWDFASVLSSHCHRYYYVYWILFWTPLINRILRQPLCNPLTFILPKLYPHFSSFLTIMFNYFQCVLNIYRPNSKYRLDVYVNLAFLLNECPCWFGW